MQSRTYDLFISYKSENLNLASQLYERLIGKGFSVWFDKARLNPGCKWHLEIEEGCEASRIILPVLTPAWKDSEWTKFETYGAEFVIPLLYEGKFEDAAPLPLCEIQFIDFRQPGEENWNKLFASIHHYLSQAPPEKTRRLASVPYAHNPYFIGREKHLLDIHEKLCLAPSTALTQVTAQAVSGLGGVGKTTLAREYAEKFWRLYRDILWVRADRPIILEFQRLAEELKLIGERSKDPEDDARRAMQELSSQTRRLLIMDNALDEESIQKWIPTTGRCRTLITSRFAGWSAVVQNIQIDVLEPSQARELLLKRSGMPDSEENQESAGRVAKELGYLPLALEHAAAFVQKASISFAQYLIYYSGARSRRDLIAQRVLGSTQYPESVATTWLVTIGRLGPLARSILTLIGFLAPDDIPRSVISEGGDFLRESILEMQPANEQDGIETSAYALDKALAELKDFSMISLQQENLSVHRLVQAVQRDGLNDSLQRRWAERAVRAVYEVFPDVEYSNWPLCSRFIPHVRPLALLIDEYGFDFSEAARLLNQAGYYLNERAQYIEAEPLWVRALTIREKTLDAEHPDVAQSLNNLALLYRNQGKYAEAEPLYRRALAIYEKTLGAEHPHVANSINNLAELYRDQGKYAEAEPLLVRAMAIYEKALGAEHPDVALSLNSLAALYYNQGKYADAEPLHRRALAISEKALGVEHPDVAQSLNNLAALYRNQGKYAEAEPLWVRALAIYEKALGAEHPSVALSLNNLAALYYNQGKYMEAEPLYRRALAIREKALGAEHPDVAQSPGTRWQGGLAGGLRASATCAVFIGKDDLDNWESEELDVAQNRAANDRDFRIIPVLLPGLPDPFDPSPLPPFLLSRSWVDFRPGLNDARALNRLLCAIKGIPPGPEYGGSPVATDDRTKAEIVPYLGLQTFDEADARLFFGREADVQRLVEKLKAARFLAVIGASGSGKSSLVRAGLVPALRRNALPGSDQWMIHVFRPGARPLAELALHLVQLRGEDQRPGALTEMEQELRRDERAMHNAVRLKLASLQLKSEEEVRRRVLLVIDQFEEVFTLCHDDDERKRFLDNLLYASAALDGRSIVVLTMRADFYYKCAAYGGLSARMAAHQYLVGPMVEENLRQAVEEPARLVGLKIEPELIAEVLAEVSNQPGTLPLLEYALLEVWKRRREGRLTLKAYRESGGVKEALAQRAEAVFTAFSPNQQEIVQRVMLRLTQPGEGTDDTRRRARMSEMLTRPDEREIVAEVINTLANERLLTTSADEHAQDQIVDVSHETLIRGWPRLRNWVEEDRAGLRTLLKLNDAAQEWQRENRDEGLLYRGARLAVALEWRARNEGRLSELEREFLVASESLKVREEEEREATRRRELEAAQKLAETEKQRAATAQELAKKENQRAESEKRSSTRLRYFLAGLASLLVASAILSLIAYTQKKQAVAESEKNQRLLYAADMKAAFQASERGDVEEVRRLLEAHLPSAGTDLRRFEWFWLWRVYHNEKAELKGHAAFVDSVAFSPDGKTLASSGWDNAVKLWLGVVRESGRRKGR